jgi:hypothetical protein
MEQAGKPVLDNGAIFHIVSGCITIIKSSQQLTLNGQQSAANSQQSTVNYSGGVQPELISDLTNFIVVRSRIISNKKPPPVEVF